MKISTKSEMYQIYLNGGFGNRLATWGTLDEYLHSGYEGNVVLRYSETSRAGEFIAYDTARDKVTDVVYEWVCRGAIRKYITVNSAAPDDKLLIQGEVFRNEDHIYLRYSTLCKPMRVALKEAQQHAKGLVAYRMLWHYLDYASYENLWELLDKYPTAVIEFSTWSVDVGDIPGRNTIVWEVRDY